MDYELITACFLIQANKLADIGALIDAMGIVNVVDRNWLAENTSTASCEREKKMKD